MNLISIKYNRQKVRSLVLDYLSKNKGETQLSLASKIGASKTAMFWSNPTADTLSKIANFFHVDVNYFFDMPESYSKSGTKRGTQDYTALRNKKNESESREDLYKKLFEQQMEITLLREQLHKNQ